MGMEWNDLLTEIRAAREAIDQRDVSTKQRVDGIEA
jgi:hypothetical protein